MTTKCKKHQYVAMGYKHPQHDNDLPYGDYCTKCGMKRGAIGWNKKTQEWVY